MPRQPADSDTGPSRARLVTRACDACKIRKIKCSESAPCRACLSSGIQCTFHQRQATRGPRNLRLQTRQRIAHSQQLPTAPLVGSTSSSSSNRSHPVYLASFIRLYECRLYPIWPILDAPALIHELENLDCHPRTLVLAHAIRLAVIAQLRLDDHADLPGHDLPSPSEDHDGTADLTGLRTCFFRHVYYENQDPGGVRSLTHLRQALTIAQIMRLDRESSYSGFSDSEQQMRRRVIWLLFVTERGVAMLHELPVILKPTTLLPSPDGDVLTSFLKLVGMFMSFQASGVFDSGVLHADADMPTILAARDSLELLQANLSDMPVDAATSNDTQRADLFVTGQWMRAILWRAVTRFGMPNTAINPVRIAKELLSFFAQVPQAAIDAHGPTIEFKTFEIASAVIDAITTNALPVSPHNEPEEVLRGLQGMLSSSRGGNAPLVASLWLKMATIYRPNIRHLSSPGARVAELFESEYSIQTSMVESSAQSYETNLAPAFVDLGSVFSSGIFGRASGPSISRDSIVGQHLQQTEGPLLDLSSPLRTPSPITRMILEQLQPTFDEDVSHLESEPAGKGS